MIYIVVLKLCTLIFTRNVAYLVEFNRHRIYFLKFLYFINLHIVFFKVGI
jgi:hypothetical protein